MDEPKDGVDGGNIQRSATTVNPSLDIEKLAEKVYQLMRAEARLARARGQQRSTRR